MNPASTMNAYDFLYENFGKQVMPERQDNMMNYAKDLFSFYKFAFNNTGNKEEHKILLGALKSELTILITEDQIFSTSNFLELKGFTRIKSIKAVTATKTTKKVEGKSFMQQIDFQQLKGKPFILLACTSKNFNVTGLRISYDLAHVVKCNAEPAKSVILNLS